jgi:hypothetical protein
MFKDTNDGQTHWTCGSRNKGECCDCFPHEGCTEREDKSTLQLPSEWIKAKFDEIREGKTSPDVLICSSQNALLAFLDKFHPKVSKEDGHGG